MEPREGRAVRYKAVILLFPDVSLSEARQVIDETQLKLKLEFIARGLMIGEFRMCLLCIFFTLPYNAIDGTITIYGLYHRQTQQLAWSSQ